MANQNVGIEVKASLDTKPAEVDLQAFVEQMKTLAKQVADANKVKFNPIDKATLADLQKVTELFKQLKQMPGVAQRLKITGQAGAPDPFAVNYGTLYEDPRLRAQRMALHYRFITQGTSFAGALGGALPSPAAPGPRPGAQPQGGGGGGGAAPGASPGGFTAQTRRVTSAGLRAAGPLGGIADDAIGVGLKGGLMAGLGGFLGGIAAFGVGKLIGGAREKIGDAQNELVGYDTLKRSLGDVNVSFNMLKESVRAASDSMDVTFQEGQRLAQTFARIGNVSQKGAETLAEEVGIAGGFSRGFGIDPSAGVRFFATMRQFHATSNENDSRRLAIMIGDAVAKSGAFAKSDELLQAIASYTTQQTRLGLTAANVPGYAGSLASLVGSGIPGLDPTGAAALLGRVNSSIASGGSAGEAGQNFLYQALGQRLGLSPVETRLLWQQGAFGTGASMFGGSLWKNFASKYHVATPGAASQSGATNLQMILQSLESQYRNNPEVMLNAMGNLFGVNESQAMALATIKTSSLTGLLGSLKKAGVNIKDVSPSGISRLSQMYEHGDLSKMSPEQIKQIASQNQEETEGSKTRRTIVGVQNEITRLATLAVPALNDMRDALIYMAGGSGKHGPGYIHEQVMRAESQERINAINAHYGGLEQAQDATNAAYAKQYAAYQDQTGRLRHNLTPAQYAARMKQEQRMRQHILELRDRTRALADEHRAAIQAEQARSAGDISAYQSSLGGGGTPGTSIGVGDQLMNALFQQESGGHNYGPDGKLLRSPKGALGLAQVMPNTGKDPGFGVAPLRNNTPAEQRRFARDYLNALITHYHGNVKQALAAYNDGPGNVDKSISAYGSAWMAHLPKETQNYVPDIMARAGLTQLPDGSLVAAKGTQTTEFHHTIVVKNQDGTHLGTVSTKHTGPQPFGHS